MKDLHLEYAARMADVEYHYYAGAPGGLVQPTAIVPELRYSRQPKLAFTSFTARPRPRRFTPGL